MRAAVPADRRALWDLAYEVAGDRFLLERLQAIPKPPPASRALKETVAASAASWVEYKRTRDPGRIYSFAVRSRNSNGVFDLGSLLAETAAASRSGRVFSVLVLPGEGSTMRCSIRLYGVTRQPPRRMVTNAG